MTDIGVNSHTGTCLTRRNLDHVLASICARVNLDTTGARLIKFTNNAVFELASTPVVVRIAGSQTVRDRVSKVITTARWLAAHEMPAVQLVADMPQPIEVDGNLATLWRRVAPVGPTPTGTDLGHILCRYHGLAPPAAPIPQWRPVQPIRQRLAETNVLAYDDLAFLEAMCNELEAAIGRLDYQLPPGPIHGDSFLGNLIPGSDGPIICDFDSASIGPREWDLTPIAVGKLRFAYPNDAHERLAITYGFDILRWPGFEVLRQLRELQLVTSVVPILGSQPDLTEQWHYRFTTFKNGDRSAIWTPYR